MRTCPVCYRANAREARSCYSCGAPLPDLGGDGDEGRAPDAPPGVGAFVFADDGSIGATAPPAAPGRSRVPAALGRVHWQLAALYEGAAATAGDVRALVAAARAGATPRVEAARRALGPLAPAATRARSLIGGRGGLALTGASVAVSILAYAVLWLHDIVAAGGLVALLGAHEIGHMLALRAKGLAAHPPVFIPFVGALIGVHAQPRGAKEEAQLALAGPLAGSAAAAVCLAVAHATGVPGWERAASFGVCLNLFNLIPIAPLDGGRVAAAVSRALWPLGAVMLVALVAAHPTPVLALVAVVALGETAARLRPGRRAARPTDYDKVGRRDRCALGAAYIGLVLALVLAMLMAHA